MEAVVNKVIKHIEIATVKEAILTLVPNFKLDPHFTNFLLKSFPQYPHYHAVLKESLHTAHVIGRQHYKLTKAQMVSFIEDYLNGIKKQLVQERKDCWDVFTAKLKYSHYYSQLLDSEEYKEISKYVTRSFTA